MTPTEITALAERLDRQYRDGILNLPDDWQMVTYAEAATALRAYADVLAEREGMRGALILSLDRHRAYATGLDSDVIAFGERALAAKLKAGVEE